jgi:hypothetical protein
MRYNPILELALVGLMCLPAPAANLISNPSFETVSFGAPTSWNLGGAPNDVFVWNSSIWGPGCLSGGNPDGEGNCPVDPLGCTDTGPGGTCNYASVQTGDEAAGVYYIHQTVTGLTPGAEYEFSGWYGGGSHSALTFGNECTIFMRVREGSSPTSGTILAEASKHVENHQSGFGWEQATRYFKAPAGGTVTVVIGIDSNFQYGERAIHADALNLDLAAVSCGTQHEATAVIAYGSVALGSDAVGVQISGSGLDNVTSVKLVSAYLHAPLIELNGEITAQPGATLTADFDTATGPNGVMPIGRYDIVVEQDGCNPRVIPLGFEVTCPLPVMRFLTVNNDRGMSGDTLHTIGITGNDIEANAGLITEVRLHKTNNAGGPMSQDIVGTNIRPAGGGGDEVLVDFDLSDAEAGRWGVQVAVDHPCGGPYVYVVGGFSSAFLVYMPYNATDDGYGNPQVVWNGGFEEGYAADGGLSQCDRESPGTDPVNPKALHWDIYRVVSFTGGTKRDGAVLFPGCPGGITGDHYNGIDIHAPFGIEGKDVRFFQTIDVSPLLDGGNQLIEELNIRAEIAANGGGLGSTNTGYINLIDGTESDRRQVFTATVPETLGTFELVGDPSYNAFIPAGTAWQTTNPALLTVELRMTTTGPGWTDLPSSDPDYDWLRFHAFWVDNVRTGSFIPLPCGNNDPWFDADDDGDVDQEDFGVLQSCITGVGGGIPPLPTYCACFDLHMGPGGGDGDIAQSDVTAFENCASGPGVPAAQACDDG